MWTIVIILSCGPTPPKEHGPMIAIQKTNGQEFFIDAFEFPNQKGERPLAEMDFGTATNHCESVGKRLCTMEEWKLACGETRFTYGEEYEHNRCRSNQQNEQGHTSLMHGRTAQGESGSLAGCVNPSGVYDMNGNVEEWVLDEWRGQNGNLAGGAWYTHWRYADCSARYSREPDYRLASDRPTDSAGVRCCWSSWELSPDLIKSDAQHHTQSNDEDLPPYNAQNEVLVSNAFWMDIYEYPNVEGSLPRVGVNWFEANELCKVNGKSLCSVSQWEKACSNQDQSKYPYGNRHSPRACNDEGTSLLPAGERSECQTANGIFDLTGNVWEWTVNDLTVAELQNSPILPVKEIRGGSFASDSLKAQCSPTVGYPLTSADMATDTLGFRCCREVKETAPSPKSVAYQHSCPIDMIPHSTGCIDQFEFPNQKGMLPTHSKSLAQAKELCNNVGKHLCHETEWSVVCEGIEGRRWSYGNQFDANRCHHASGLKQGGARKSGSFEDCHTPNHVFDMTGNLWEWNASGVLRGGNWNFSEGMGQCKSIAQPASHIRNDEIGLRCCATIQEAEALNMLLEMNTP